LFPILEELPLIFAINECRLLPLSLICPETFFSILTWENPKMILIPIRENDKIKNGKGSISLNI